MRPTFMGFESMQRAIMATQKAMDIVGNNLGNIGVTGYTRQRVDLVSMGLNNRFNRYATKSTALAGQGVNIGGVSQIRDPFLDKRFREEYADVGYFDKTAAILTDITAALDEIEPAQISKAMTDFQEAWKTMLGDKGINAVNSNTILATARSLTQVFKQMDTKLNNVWEQQKFDLQVNVNSVNSILGNIASLNETIKNEIANSGNPANEYYGPNELLDQRNLLLDQLSEFGDIQTKKFPDGTVDVTMGGHPVVTGNRAETLNMVTNTSYNTISINWQTTGQPINMRTGSLAGSLDMINGRGANATATHGEGIERGVLYYKDKISVFAQKIAESFNNTIQCYEPDLLPDGTPNPNAGAKIEGAFKQLFTFTDDARTAGGITIHSDWERDPAYIITDIMKDGEGNNSTDFVNEMVNNFTKSIDFGEFKGDFKGYVTFYSTATLGNQLDYNKTRLEASTAISDSLLTRITEISGVSDTEEGVDMMQYQRAFDAMGRLVTAMDEALDMIINKMGLVGR